MYYTKSKYGVAKNIGIVVVNGFALKIKNIFYLNTERQNFVIITEFVYTEEIGNTHYFKEPILFPVALEGLQSATRVQ